MVYLIYDVAGKSGDQGIGRKGIGKSGDQRKTVNLMS